MVKHSIEVRHKEIFRLRTIQFLFFRQNMTTKWRNTCRHDVKVRIALNESEVDTL